MDTVPSKTTTQRFSQTWITTPIKKLSRRKHRAYNITRKTNKHKDWERYRSIKKKIQTECRTNDNLLFRSSAFVLGSLWSRPSLFSGAMPELSLHSPFM
jgi:hypothetical protein